MTLLEHEEIILKAEHQCEKKSFYLLNLITCLHVYALASIIYIFCYKVIQLWVFYLIATIIYLLYVFFQTNKNYEHYKKFFGNDELIVTKDKVYYNVCMNLKGNYVNRDENVLISEITDLEIKKGFYPIRLKIYFNQGQDYVVVHCLKNANEFYKYLSCLIPKKIL